jgi:hypothetical protein
VLLVGGGLSLQVLYGGKPLKNPPAGSRRAGDSDRESGEGDGAGGTADACSTEYLDKLRRHPLVERR